MLIKRFLRDRLGWIITVYTVAAFILLLVTLILYFEGLPSPRLAGNRGYALLLTTLILFIGLLVDYVRWAPFARQADSLLSRDVPLSALANLPATGTADQEACRQLVEQVQAKALAEQARYQEAHQRHLAFINMWVHQMKTPVSAINLIVQDAQAAGEVDLAAFVTDVEEETGRLDEGLDLVLHMARLQDFALDYQVARVDLLATVRQVINARRKQFIRLGLFPALQADDGDWTVLSDEKWNRFAIDQVVANALKYASQGGTDDQPLRFCLSREERFISLAIADRGPGIPPQDLPRVCEPFFTGTNGRRFGGATGIGLYLVKQVMDQLEHEFAIASTPGAGTTVTVRYRTLQK